MMKDGFERYDSYNDSEVNGLGNLPGHWRILRIKDTLKRIGSGVTPRGGSEVYTAFGIPFLRSQNVHDDGLRLANVSFISDEINSNMKCSQIKAKDILINITGASIGRTCMVPIELGHANINQHIAFLRIKYWFNTDYISLFLKSPFIKNYIQFEQNGASKEAFNLSQITNIPLVLPEKAEQQAIVEYLYINTAQIDLKIDLLTQKAALYSKLKQSLINETVTRGLDKTVAMKDSGVEWIGEVPGHWRKRRIKDLFVESKRKSVTGEETLLSVSEYSGVTQKKDNIEEDAVLTNATTLVGYKLCSIGDLAINIMLAWKRGLGVSSYEGIVSPSYAVYSPTKLACSEYFHYLFRSERAIAEFKRNSTGIIESRLRLYTDNFYALEVVIPEYEEQRSIAQYLYTKTVHIDSIIETVKVQIDRLKELRKTVINDVITGKIKVHQEGVAK